MTKAEFDAGYDGLHCPLACENHPDLRWSCKRIAISFDANGIGRYNGARHLFYFTEDAPECKCPTDKLYLVLEEEKVASK